MYRWYCCDPFDPRLTPPQECVARRPHVSSAARETGPAEGADMLRQCRRVTQDPAYRLAYLAS